MSTLQALIAHLHTRAEAYDRWPLLSSNDLYFARKIIAAFHHDDLIVLGGSAFTYGNDRGHWLEHTVSQHALIRDHHQAPLHGGLVLPTRAEAAAVAWLV